MRLAFVVLALALGCEDGDGGGMYAGGEMGLLDRDGDGAVDALDVDADGIADVTFAGGPMCAGAFDGGGAAVDLDCDGRADLDRDRPAPRGCLPEWLNADDDGEVDGVDVDCDGDIDGVGCAVTLLDGDGDGTADLADFLCR